MSGKRAASLLVMLDHIGTLPFDDDGYADRLYRYVETEFMRKALTWLISACEG